MMCEELQIRWFSPFLSSAITILGYITLLCYTEPSIMLRLLAATPANADNLLKEADADCLEKMWEPRRLTPL
jgi:hypothetical protein